MSNRIRLAIGTPSTGSVRIEFMESVLEVQKSLLTDVNLKVDAMSFLFYCSSVIPKNRIQIIDMAKRWKATHIIWIDDDMRFPAEAVKALLVGMKRHKFSILGANCIKRVYPLEYMATGFDDKEVVSTGKTGYEKVLYTGNAFVLMDMKIFDVMPKPWFAFAWNAPTQDFGTEDSFFMINAAKYGFDTYVDHDVSQTIEHIGIHVFNPLQPRVLQVEQ